MSNESSNGSGQSRASNIQKILDRKAKIFQLPRNSKVQFKDPLIRRDGLGQA